jgi:predicted nucleotidyltransferase
MNHQQVFQVLQTTLQTTLKEQLTSLYLFGSLAQDNYQPGRSDINLIAVLQDQNDIHQIRETLQPLWHEHSDIIGQMPLIATPEAFARHLKLNPILAQHLNQHGRLLSGRPQPIPSRPITPAEQLSHLAQIALVASESLTPQLLPQDKRPTAAANLDRLANRLQINRHLTNPEVTFANIQAHLAAQLNQQSDLKWQSAPQSGAPPVIPELLTIYEVQDKAIFLLPDTSPDQIRDIITETDWTAVSQTLQGQYKGLQITTPSLLRLIYRTDRTVEHFIQSYILAWGQDPLATIQPTPAQIYRDLARHPSQIQIHDLPHDYMTANTDQLNMLNHDYQNKLLNIQLREELISRFEQRRRAIPPIPLPDRHTPPHQRISAIFQHLNWWGEYYSA